MPYNTNSTHNNPRYVDPAVQEMVAQQFQLLTLEEQEVLVANHRYMNTLGQMIPVPQFKHQFITIALPTEKTELQRLIRTILNLNYDYLTDALLSVEMFSGELKKENLHIHILKQGIYSKTKIIRDLSRRFKVAPNFINVKKGTTQKDYLNRLHYINGEKDDQLKKENVILDREWRIQNNIEQLYYL